MRAECMLSACMLMASLIRWVYRRVGMELRCSSGENDEQRLEYW